MGHSLVEILLRYVNRYLDDKFIYIFESDVGYKYRFSNYPSERFVKYSKYEISFLESNINFRDLILPPDYLMNRYTNCGKNIYESPHFELMEKLEKGKIIDNSDYIIRKRCGTLDARLPSPINLQAIIEKYRSRKYGLMSKDIFVISILKIIYRGNVKYLIADGKHRVAMAAYLELPESIKLRFITNNFMNDTYFLKLSSRILDSDKSNYSINQEMIRHILNESIA